MPTLWLVGVNKLNPSLRDWRLRRMIIDKLAPAAVWQADSPGAKLVDGLGPSGRSKIRLGDAVVYFTDEDTSFFKGEPELFDRTSPV
jgi:hypothetical protein